MLRLLQYLYANVWHNVGAVNDDFFGAFLFVLNAWLIVFFSLANLAMDTNYINPMYNLCLGSPPEPALSWTGAPIPVISR